TDMNETVKFHPLFLLKVYFWATLIKSPYASFCCYNDIQYMFDELTYGQNLKAMLSTIYILSTI
ncbi:hypothetical protein, partial [Pseudogracilibacillus auburnensis]